MKYYRYILITVGLFLMMSCDKDIKVNSNLDFDVHLDQLTFKAGEKVTFNFSGFAENISFYSGELYNEYEFKDGREVSISDKGAIFSFSTAVNDGSQENQLSVFISTDFDGNYNTLESVKSASWINITDSFSLATSSNFTTAGNLDISQYAKDKPVYIAFKYITEPQMENGDARNWMIENFNIKTRDNIYDKPINIVVQNQIGFNIVEQDKQKTPSRTTFTSTRLNILGNTYNDPADPIFNPDNPIFNPDNPIYDPNSDVYDSQAVLPTYVPYDPNNPYNDPKREIWVVTNPIHIDKIDLGPDWSIGIRGIRSPKLVEYSYSYSKPGTYKAVFVGKNNTIDETLTLIREIEVVIE